MADMLEMFDDGSASFFTSLDVPEWHKKGISTGRCLDVDEAIETAQLHRIYSIQPIQAVVEDEEGIIETFPLPENFAIMGQHPKTGKTWHGVVGNRYELIQIRQGFQVLNDIVDLSGAHFETAGSIEDGDKVFMTLKLPDHLDCAAITGDPIEVYLAAWNSFDGNQSFTLAVTPVRIRCKNTLDLAQQHAYRTFKIRHTASAQARLSEARHALDLTFTYLGSLAEDIDRMLEKVYTDVQFEALTRNLFPVPVDPKAQDFVIQRALQSQRELRMVYASPTVDNIRGTAWGALNAVVEWADYYSPVRGKDKADARAVKVLTGGTGPIKQKAYNLINV